jgi:hypothetical protein
MSRRAQPCDSVACVCRGAVRDRFQAASRGMPRAPSPDWCRRCRCCASGDGSSFGVSVSSAGNEKMNLYLRNAFGCTVGSMAAAIRIHDWKQSDLGCSVFCCRTTLVMGSACTNVEATQRAGTSGTVKRASRSLLLLSSSQIRRHSCAFQSAMRARSRTSGAASCSAT